MNSRPESRLPRRLLTFARTASFLSILVATLTLIGWSLSVPVLASFHPTGVAMNPLTALCFILAGFSLWLLAKPRPQLSPVSIPHRLAQLSAAAVALAALLRLGDVIFGWQIGIDQILLRSALEAAPGGWPNRMAPNTALDFLLNGVALLLLEVETRRGRRPAQFLALAAGIIALLALVGYAYGVTGFYTLPLFIPMALNTALLFLLLSLGILCARPTAGFMAVFLSDSYGGSIARRLLLPALILPLVLGKLRWTGEDAGLYGTQVGVAVYTTSLMIVLGLAVWWTATWLNRAHLERRRAQQELDNVFNLSLDLFCIAGFDGYFKRLNPAWGKTLGYSQEELLARPYVDFIHPEDRAATRAEADKIAAGATTLSFENRYRARDGSYRWFLWTATPDTQQGLIFAAARDVTERKRAEQALLELNRELQAFTYSVSHDLRAPLRHIDGFSKILHEDFGATLGPEARRYLERIRHGTRQMGRLIDDLLELSRVSRRDLRRQPIPLTPLVKEVCAQLQPELNGRQVEWHLEELPVVEADRALLKIVLVNLLSNALKYSRPRSPALIEVGQAEQNGQPVVFVRDNGVGFDMKYAHKLFGVFQRLHRPEDFEGTGVGLATVERIIRKHGGRVWAEGRPDAGATFYFYLPLPGSLPAALETERKPRLGSEGERTPSPRNQGGL